jgi:ferric-chelate reductase
MILPLFFAFVALLWAQATYALSKNKYCVNAIYEAYGYLAFEGSSPDDYWALCTNPLEVNSIYAAALKYCKPADVDAGLAMLEEYCTEYGEVELLPMSEFADTLTDSYIDSMRVVDYEEIPLTENVTTTVLISRTYFMRSYRTIVSGSYEFFKNRISPYRE